MSPDRQKFYLSPQATTIIAPSRSEASEKDEILGLFDISALIRGQKTAYSKFLGLSFQQQREEKPEEELFGEMLSVFDDLRDPWGQKYLEVSQSIMRKTLPWEISNRYPSAFLSVNPDGTVKIDNFELAEGEKVMRLDINTPFASVMSYPELMEQYDWYRKVRYTFSTARVITPRIETITLEVDEVTVVKDPPSTSAHKKDYIYVKGSRIFKPNRKGVEKPEIEQSFVISVYRPPVESSLPVRTHF